jgi:DNA-directed RNA polymerase subunit beta'
MGLITNNERYNQVIDVWTSANAQLTLAMKNIREDQQGFNSVYMMLDSGAGFQRTNSSVNWYAWFDG